MVLRPRVALVAGAVVALVLIAGPISPAAASLLQGAGGNDPACAGLHFSLVEPPRCGFPPADSSPNLPLGIAAKCVLIAPGSEEPNGSDCQDLDCAGAGTAADVSPCERNGSLPLRVVLPCAWARIVAPDAACKDGDSSTVREGQPLCWVIHPFQTPEVTRDSECGRGGAQITVKLPFPPICGADCNATGPPGGSAGGCLWSWVSDEGDEGDECSPPDFPAFPRAPQLPANATPGSVVCWRIGLAGETNCTRGLDVGVPMCWTIRSWGEAPAIRDFACNANGSMPQMPGFPGIPDVDCFWASIFDDDAASCDLDNDTAWPPAWVRRSSCDPLGMGGPMRTSRADLRCAPANATIRGDPFGDADVCAWVKRVLSTPACDGVPPARGSSGSSDTVPAPSPRPATNIVPSTVNGRTCLRIDPLQGLVQVACSSMPARETAMGCERFDRARCSSETATATRYA